MFEPKSETTTAEIKKKKRPKKEPVQEATTSAEALENKIKQIEIECDKICDANPKNFLFFTKYGSRTTPEQLARDSAVDLDLRLVCFEIPTASQQLRIRRKLQGLTGSIPVELYFHTYDKYIQGEVGETGDYSSLDVIKYAMNPKSTITKVSSTLLSLYTFGTMNFFTQKSSEQLQDHIDLAFEKQFKNKTQAPQLEMLNPKKIADALTIEQEDVTEWIHIFLKYFIAEYREMQFIKLHSPEEFEALQASYIQRLSKYLIRIAFGVAISGINLDSFKDEYQQLLEFGIHSDLVHFQMIGQYGPSWKHMMHFKNIINTAVNIRTGDFETMSKLSEVQGDLIPVMENTILFLTQQTGSVSRQKKFEYVQDFISELLMNNLLKLDFEDKNEKLYSSVVTFKPGESLTQLNSKSQYLYFLPEYKSDGTLNGTYSIRTAAGIVPFDRTKRIIGEIGILTDQPSTAAVIADTEIEAVQIDGTLLTDLLKAKGISSSESLVHYVFSSHFQNTEISAQARNSLDETNRAFLIFTFLKYFSIEFVKYFQERMNTGAMFESANILQGSQESSISKNALDQYKIPFFHHAVRDTVTKFSVPHEVLTTSDSEKEKQELFNSGDDSGEFFYVILDATETGGVALQFEDGTQKTESTLKTGDFFGEETLLPEKAHRKYAAFLMPGTTVIKISGKDFLEKTVNTEITHVAVNQQSFTEVMPAELLFHIGAVNLERLQASFKK